MTDKPFPDYPFLNEAAAEAREASRRFWQGKPSYPVHWWKIPLVDDPEKKLAESLKRHHRKSA